MKKAIMYAITLLLLCSMVFAQDIEGDSIGYHGYLMKDSTNRLIGTNNLTHVNLGTNSNTGIWGGNSVYSTVLGGQYNNAGGDYSVVVNGYDNGITGQYSVIGGGIGGYILGNYDVISGGKFGSISGDYSNIAGGNANTIFGKKNSILGGEANYIKGEGSVILGGSANFLTANNSGIFGKNVQLKTDNTFVFATNLKITNGNITLDNLKYINFLDPTGNDDGTKIYRASGGGLRIRNGNAGILFDLAGNNQYAYVGITNGASSPNLFLYPNGSIKSNAWAGTGKRPACFNPDGTLVPC